jgi:hypothetical protein
MNEQVPADPLATPKTDAAAFQLANDLRTPFLAQHIVVPADFARQQERRIVELESALQEISELISGHDDYVFDDITKVLLGTKP